MNQVILEYANLVGWHQRIVVSLGSSRTMWTGVILASTRFTVDNSCRESSNCCNALAKTTHLIDLVGFSLLAEVTTSQNETRGGGPLPTSDEFAITGALGFP